MYIFYGGETLTLNTVFISLNELFFFFILFIYPNLYIEKYLSYCNRYLYINY